MRAARPSPVDGRRLLKRANLFENFLAVAEHGGIRASTARLNLSQSAVTRRIRELEEALGLVLFERHAHGMRLTAIGEVLLHHAQRVEQTCGYAAGEINDLLGGSAGELRIAAGPAWSYRLCPDAVAAVQRELPGIRMHLVSRLSPETLPMLSAGKFDVVLGGMPEPGDRDPEIIYEPVLDIEYWIVAHDSHPLASKSIIAPTDVADASWIWLSGSQTVRDAFAAWAGRPAGHDVPSSVETTSIQAGFRLLESTRYLMLLPHTLVPIAGRHGLVRLETQGLIDRYSSGLMYRASALRLRSFSALRAHLIRCARKADVEAQGGLAP